MYYDNAPINQYLCHTRPNQQWQFALPVGSKGPRVITPPSNHAFCIARDAQHNLVLRQAPVVPGVPTDCVRTVPGDGLWTLEPSSGTTFDLTAIRNTVDSACVDVPNASTDTGVQLHTFSPCNFATNEHWVALAWVNGF